MKNYKFKAPPELAIDALPFDLNEQAFNDWLGGLSFRNSFLACNKLYSALKALDRIVVDLKFEFLFFHSIVPVVDNFAERLEFSYVDSGFPLTEEALAHVEILVWTYMHLTTRFSRLYRKLDAEGERWTQIEKADTLYRAFYTAALVQLYANEVYILVHDGFWQVLFQNYLQVEKANLFNHCLSESEDNDPTIDSVFKQILIFDICDTNCFRSREMKNLYVLLKRFSEKAVIMKNPPALHDTGVFQFNLNSDMNPQKWRPEMTAGDDFRRFVDVVPVAKSLYGSLRHSENNRNTLQSINKDLLFKVVTMLSRGQQRKATRFATQGDAAGFIGFNNTVSIIAKARGKTADHLIPAPKYDPRIAGHWKEPDFDLVPLGDEFEHHLQLKRNHRGSVNSKTMKIFQAGKLLKSQEEGWAEANSERNRLKEDISIGHFDVCNSSIKGYGLHWRSGANKVKIGEIFGIEQDQGKRYEIGLVRRIAIHSDQTLRLGIELIGFESDIVWLVRSGVDKSQGVLAIFVPAITIMKQPDSIVIADTRLITGTNVVICLNDREISCKLGDLLHSTPVIKHFELINAAEV